MDIKPENLLIGEDCNLKIIDFDFSMKTEEGVCLGKGSKNFRAPEVKKGKSLKNPTAADVYSAAVVLFCFL